MNIARIEHELFVLMLHLNREAGSEMIRTTFVEELNRLFSPVSFRFSEKQSVNAIGMIAVATLTNTFGSIEIMDKENVLSTDMIHVIRNACNMLAIILENLIGRERLADENVRLEEAVRQRTRELSEINDRLNREILEKIEVEKSLTEAKKLMSNAIENAPIGMALLETNGRFYRVNQSFCSMLGFSEAEMLKMDFQAITHPEDIQVGPVMMLKILTGEQDTARYTKRYIRKDRKSTRLNSSHRLTSRMPSSA
jgi:PAS domain S-box-containing protein